MFVAPVSEIWVWPEGSSSRDGDGLDVVSGIFSECAAAGGLTGALRLLSIGNGLDLGKQDIVEVDIKNSPQCAQPYNC